MSEADIRTYARIPFISMVYFTVMDVKRNRALVSSRQGLVKNMSAGGMYFECAALKPRVVQKLVSGEAAFFVQFELKNFVSKMGLMSSLRWYKDTYDFLETNKNGFGVEFMGVQKHQREKLLDYVASMKTKAIGV